MGVPDWIWVASDEARREGFLNVGRYNGVGSAKRSRYLAYVGMDRFSVVLIVNWMSCKVVLVIALGTFFVCFVMLLMYIYSLARNCYRTSMMAEIIARIECFNQFKLRLKADSTVYIRAVTAG